MLSRIQRALHRVRVEASRRHKRASSQQLQRLSNINNRRSASFEEDFGVSASVRVMMAMLRSAMRMDPELMVDILDVLDDLLPTDKCLSLTRVTAVMNNALIKVTEFLFKAVENPKDNWASGVVRCILGLSLARGSLTDLLRLVTMLAIPEKGDAATASTKPGLGELECSTYLNLLNNQDNVCELNVQLAKLPQQNIVVDGLARGRGIRGGSSEGTNAGDQSSAEDHDDVAGHVFPGFGVVARSLDETQGADAELATCQLLAVATDGLFLYIQQGTVLNT